MPVQPLHKECQQSLIPTHSPATIIVIIVMMMMMIIIIIVTITRIMAKIIMLSSS